VTQEDAAGPIGRSAAPVNSAGSLLSSVTHEDAAGPIGRSAAPVNSAGSLLSSLTIANPFSKNAYC
jgi:hypothetical protein